MWSADKKGEYRFSDRVECIGHQNFLSMLADDQLAAELADKLAGQTLSEAAVEAFVLTKTPFYKFKDQVNKLRSPGNATPRARGTWPVTFAAR